MSIIAHRGDSYLYNENTIDAFKSAIMKYVDYIELDINKTEDMNKYVICHDRIPHNNNILTYDNFIKFISSEEFKIMIIDNIKTRGKPFRILLDLKFDKNELDEFMNNKFDLYTSCINTNIPQLITIVQTSIICGLSDYNIFDSEQYEISYLYMPNNTNFNILDLQFMKLYLCGLDIEYIRDIDHVMININQLNPYNILLIKLQLFILMLFGHCIHFDVYTVNNKYIKYILLFLNINVVTDIV